MTCKICIKYALEQKSDIESNYKTGCKNFRRPSLAAHENSECHSQNVSKEKSKTRPRGTSDGEKAIRMLNRAAFTLRWYYYSKMHIILQRQVGHIQTSHSYVAWIKPKVWTLVTLILMTNTATYLSAPLQIPRGKSKIPLLNRVHFCPSSVTVPRTPSKEAEIVLLRSSFQCKVYTHFMSIKNVPKADGENISKVIITCLTERYGDDWKGKVIAMGTDGASVMLGQKSGVVLRIREYTDRPFIYAIHCSAHRLELAFKDGLKVVKSTTPQKCDAFLLNLYLFYKYSQLNRANLKASYKSLGLKMKVPTRVGRTRWLPHTKKAVDHILYGYPAIVLHLEQLQKDFDGSQRKESAAKGRNFLKLLKDRAVTFWLHLLMDIVTALSQVSKAIQQQNISLADVWSEVESAKVILTKYKTSPGPYLRKWFSKDESEEPMLESSRQQFLQGIVNGICSRFEGDLHLFKGSCFTSFKNWPTSLDEDLEDFADEHVVEMVKLCEPALHHASPELEVESIELEWTRFKKELYNRMKLVKNDWRSCLDERSLSDLMLIHSESESVDKYDPTEAINMWNASGSRARRPFYNDKIKPIRTRQRNVDVNNGDVYMVAEEMEEPAEMLKDIEKGIESDESESDDEYEQQHLQDLLALQNRAYKMMLDKI